MCIIGEKIPMKKQITLSVESPCDKNWAGFSATPTGGFCSSCNKNVIDFSRMSDRELLNYFTQPTSSTCGRFRQDQLKTYFPAKQLQSRPLTRWLQVGILSAVCLVSSKTAMAQAVSSKALSVQVPRPIDAKTKDVESSASHWVSGTVRDENNEPLAGANIRLLGTDQGTVCNLNGYFEFPVPLNSGDILEVSFIGYEPITYRIPENSPAKLEITLKIPEACVVMMGKVAVDQPYSDRSGVGKVWDRMKGWFR